jgi:hypothetical protein
MSTTFAEVNRHLWAMVAGPAIWAGHFLLSYATAAIWCAKLAGPDGSLSGVRAAIGAYSVAALTGIALVSWWAWRRHHAGNETSRDRDTPADRHRFLAHATLLLGALSAVAVVYATFAIVFVEDCR